MPCEDAPEVDDQMLREAVGSLETQMCRRRRVPRVWFRWIHFSGTREAVLHSGCLQGWNIHVSTTVF